MSEKGATECPACGKPMKVGKLFGSSVSVGGKTNIVWVDGTQGWRKRERLDSEWNPKGVGAHRCKECGIIILYERRNKLKTRKATRMKRI